MLSDYMVHRVKYRRVETGYVKATRVGVIIVTALFSLAGVLVFIPGLPDGSVLLLHISLPVALIGLLMREYISVHFRFLLLTYNCQRYEFNQHACREILVYAIQIACMGTLFFLNFQDLFGTACSLYLEKWPDQAHSGAGICSSMHEARAEETNAQENFSLLLAHLSQDAPFFFYILLARPHDCYECYSVQPGLVISLFQANWEAKAKRKYFSRTSMKLDGMSLSVARNVNSPGELRRALAGMHTVNVNASTARATGATNYEEADTIRTSEALAFNEDPRFLQYVAGVVPETDESSINESSFRNSQFSD